MSSAWSSTHSRPDWPRRRRATRKFRSSETLARRKAVKDPLAQLERNRAFHRAIYASCENAALIAYLDQLWDRTDRYRFILVKQELLGGPVSTQDHIDIADAIAARDAERAALLTRNHIARSRKSIADIMACAPHPVDLRHPGHRGGGRRGVVDPAVGAGGTHSTISSTPATCAGTAHMSTVDG